MINSTYYKILSGVNDYREGISGNGYSEEVNIR